MRALPLLAVSLLAACSPPAPDNRSASREAPSDATGPTAVAAASPTLPEAAPTPAPTSAAAVTPAASADPGSAEAAADVARRYFAAIEKGDYRTAYALWDDSGKAAGMNADAFAHGFDKYAEYHAEIGTPGDMDAGAGQRYVTVPVRAFGRLKSGGNFFLRGSLVLHRVGDIDGATAAQKSWHIRNSDLSPNPQPADAAPATPPVVTARFRCIDGSHMTARFDNQADKVTLSRGGKPIATLAGQRPASGIWYKGEGYELRGKGEEATFSAPGQPPLPCTSGH